MKYLAKTVIGVFLLMLGAMLLVGCTTTYQSKSLSEPQNALLERGQKCYVALPRNGFFDATVYPNSGESTARLLRSALAPYTAEVHTGAKVESLPEAKSSAKKLNARYLFVPEIIHWEQRAAAWSGIPSKVSLILSVYDLGAGTDTSIFARELSTQGRRATFVSQYVEDILEPLLKQFVESAFSVPQL